MERRRPSSARRLVGGALRAVTLFAASCGRDTDTLTPPASSTDPGRSSGGGLTGSTPAVQDPEVSAEQAAAARAALERGKQAFLRRRMEDAQAAFEEATTLDPRPVEAWEWLGRSRIVQSPAMSPSKGIAAYEEALRRDPNSAQALWGIGLASVALSDHDAARRSLEKLFARAEPGLPDAQLAEAHTFYGSVLVAEGDDEAALPHLRLACQLSPGFAECSYQLALAEEHLGHPDAARAAYEETLRREPLHGSAHFRLGRLEAAAGHDEAAKKHAEIHRILTDLTDNTSQRVQGDLARRERLLGELLRLLPEHAPTRVELASLVMRRSPQEAGLLLDQLLRDGTEEANAYVLRARIAADQGDETRAREVLRLLHEKRPEYSADQLPPGLSAYFPERLP